MSGLIVGATTQALGVGATAVDFTLKAYAEVLSAARETGYKLCTIADCLSAPEDGVGRLIALRHDVDRRPRNALQMAKLEASQGIRSTYYFRIVPASFSEPIIRQIAALGHEVGYHYEDWHRADYLPARAIGLFEDALAQLRAIAPIETISMHGSPLSRENNLTIWKHVDFERYGVKDCGLSHSWRRFAYFTDAGRTFGATAANLRDTLGEADTPASVRTTRQLADFVRTAACDRIVISTHPERWSDEYIDWARQWAWDFAANSVKYAMVAVGIRRSGMSAG